MERRWNDTDIGNPTYPEEHPSLYHSVHRGPSLGSAILNEIQLNNPCKYSLHFTVNTVVLLHLANHVMRFSVRMIQNTPIHCVR